MRISRSVSIIALAGLLAAGPGLLPGLLPQAAFAQDSTEGKTDAEAPAGAAFGPRAGQHSQIKSGDKTATMMRVLAPIGVFLPTGIPVEIDGAALPNRLQFTQCAPRICEAMGEFSDETLGKFKKGSKSTFYIYAKAGSGIPMNVSLDGFGAAVAELAKY